MAFYSGNLLITAASLVALPFSVEAFAGSCATGPVAALVLTYLLGCEIVLEAPLAEPVLYAIKHESFFEAIDAPALFDTPSVFAKQELFAIPLWGRAAAAFGLVPVEREAGAKALMKMIRSAKALVADGQPLVIFPEGTRVPHGENRALQSGFAGLYKMLGLPVVPVAVDSGEVYHRLYKRPGQITYRFAEPIPPGLPRDEVEARARGHQRAQRLTQGLPLPEPTVQPVAKRHMPDVGHGSPPISRFTAAVACLAGMSPLHAARGPVREWEIGPRIRGRNYSLGMPSIQRPRMTGGSSIFRARADGHVHYLTRRTAPLDTARGLRLRYRIDAAPLRASSRRNSPTGRRRCRSSSSARVTTGWHATAHSSIAGIRPPIGSSTRTGHARHNDLVRGELDQRDGLDRERSPRAFADTLTNAARIGFTLGSAGGRGHGVFATGPRLTVLDFAVL